MLLIQFLLNFPNYLTCLRWAEGYKIINSKRNLPVYLTTLRSNLQSSPKVKYTLFKLGTWIFVIDDLLDENKTGEEALSIFEENSEHTDFGSLTSYRMLFKDITASVRALAGDELSMDTWHKSARKMAEDMLLESKLSDDLETYLQHSESSVGLYMYNYGLAISMKIDLANNKEELDELISLSARYVRLINDLVSYERERADGKLNSVDVIMRQHNVSVEEARTQIAQLAQSYYSQLISHPTKFYKFKCNVIRYVDFIRKLYSMSDYHNSKLIGLADLLITT